MQTALRRPHHFVPAVAVSLILLAQTSTAETYVWNTETVDTGGTVGEHTSIAFDTLGNAAVSYVDRTTNSLKLARHDGVQWNLEVVDGSGTVYGYTSLAFDFVGNPAISYWGGSGNGELRWARHNGSTWSVEIIATDAGRGTSLSFDALGFAAIGYYSIWRSESWSSLARHNGTTWTTERIQPVAGGDDVTLAFDLVGDATLAYLSARQSSPFRYRAAFSRPTGPAWEHLDPATNQVRGVAFAYNPLGEATLAFGDWTEGELEIATLSAGVWVPEVLFLKAVDHVSLRFDSVGEPMIAFHAFQDGDLMVAHKHEAAWRFDLVDTNGFVGEHNSLAVDASGLPAISYFDADNGDLKVARGSRCAGASLGMVTDLVARFSPAGNPLLSWSADPMSAGYHVNTVGMKAELANPTRSGFGQAACDTPSSDPNCELAPSVGDAFYQVLSTCDASVEGPF